MKPISQELAKKMDIKKRQRIFQFHGMGHRSDGCDGSRPALVYVQDEAGEGVGAVERCAGAFCTR